MSLPESSLLANPPTPFPSTASCSCSSCSSSDRSSAESGSSSGVGVGAGVACPSSVLLDVGRRAYMSRAETELLHDFAEMEMSKERHWNTNKWPWQPKYTASAEFRSSIMSQAVVLSARRASAVREWESKSLSEQVAFSESAYQEQRNHPQRTQATPTDAEQLYVEDCMKQWREDKKHQKQHQQHQQEILTLVKHPFYYLFLRNRLEFSEGYDLPGQLEAELRAEREAKLDIHNMEQQFRLQYRTLHPNACAAQATATAPATPATPALAHAQASNYNSHAQEQNQEQQQRPLADLFRSSST